MIKSWFREVPWAICTGYGVVSLSLALSLAPDIHKIHRIRKKKRDKKTSETRDPKIRNIS